MSTATMDTRDKLAAAASEASMFGHPLRLRIILALGEHPRTMYSPTMLADQFGEKLPNLSYHIRMLNNGGLIDCVKTLPRRGAIEHYYMLTARGKQLLKIARAWPTPK